jgi:hypothetical protein
VVVTGRLVVVGPRDQGSPRRERERRPAGSRRNVEGARPRDRGDLTRSFRRARNLRLLEERLGGAGVGRSVGCFFERSKGIGDVVRCKQRLRAGDEGRPLRTLHGGRRLGGRSCARGDRRTRDGRRRDHRRGRPDHEEPAEVAPRRDRPNARERENRTAAPLASFGCCCAVVIEGRAERTGSRGARRSGSPSQRRRGRW